MVDRKELIKDYFYYTYEGDFSEIAYKVEAVSIVSSKVFVVYTYVTKVADKEVCVDNNVAEIELIDLICFVYRSVF
jgi:hypothetical protein